jgi:hypothetical protein
MKQTPPKLAGAALALLSFGALDAEARLPAAVAASDFDLQQVGRGELRYFGFSIYDASLWTPGGEFVGFLEGRPVALSLWYKRSFSRDELVDITAQAWRKLGTVPVPQQRQWTAQLGRIWNDVTAGDNMTTIVLPGRATVFYDQRGRVGRIDDPQFGPAFLNIWLDRQSVVGDLRAALLGLE